MSEAAQAEPNCPFYGRHIALMLLGSGSIPRQGLQFVRSGGNQCALVLQSCHPCELEIEHKPVTWWACPVWQAATIMPRWRP